MEGMSEWVESIFLELQATGMQDPVTIYTEIARTHRMEIRHFLSNEQIRFAESAEACRAKIVKVIQNYRSRERCEYPHVAGIAKAWADLLTEELAAFNPAEHLQRNKDCSMFPEAANEPWPS